jgi:hypothetical protein
VTQIVSRKELEQVENMPKKKEKERGLWGVPVSESRGDKCEGHIILKESGKRKRAKKCLSSAVEVGINWKGRTIWVCRECWNKISDANIEWDENDGKKD